MPEDALVHLEGGAVHGVVRGGIVVGDIEEGKDAGDHLLEIGEVLVAHGGLHILLHELAAHVLGHGGGHLGRHRRIVHDRRRAVHPVNSAFAAERGGDALDDLVYALHIELLGGRAGGADGAFHEHFGGDDVPGGAGMYLADGEHARLVAGQLAGGDVLQRGVHLRGGGDGVVAQRGLRAVAALALDADDQAVAGGHHAAGLHDYGAGRELRQRPDVHAHAGGDLGVLHKAALDDHLRAGDDLLAGLEEELDGAVELVLYL